MPIPVGAEQPTFPTQWSPWSIQGILERQYPYVDWERFRPLQVTTGEVAPTEKPEAGLAWPAAEPYRGRIWALQASGAMPRMPVMLHEASHIADPTWPMRNAGNVTPLLEWETALEQLSNLVERFPQSAAARRMMATPAYIARYWHNPEAYAIMGGTTEGDIRRLPGELWRWYPWLKAPGAPGGPPAYPRATLLPFQAYQEQLAQGPADVGGWELATENFLRRMGQWPPGHPLGDYWRDLMTTTSPEGEMALRSPALPQRWVSYPGVMGILAGPAGRAYMDLGTLGYQAPALVPPDLRRFFPPPPARSAWEVR